VKVHETGNRNPSAKRKSVPTRVFELWQKHEHEFGGIRVINVYFDTFVKYELFKEERCNPVDGNLAVEKLIAYHDQGNKPTWLLSFLAHFKKRSVLSRCVSLHARLLKSAFKSGVHQNERSMYPEQSSIDLCGDLKLARTVSSEGRLCVFAIVLCPPICVKTLTIVLLFELA